MEMLGLFPNQDDNNDFFFFFSGGTDQWPETWKAVMPKGSGADSGQPRSRQNAMR